MFQFTSICVGLFFLLLCAVVADALHCHLQPLSRRIAAGQTPVKFQMQRMCGRSHCVWACYTLMHKWTMEGHDSSITYAPDDNVTLSNRRVAVIQ